MVKIHAASLDVVTLDPRGRPLGGKSSVGVASSCIARNGSYADVSSSFAGRFGSSARDGSWMGFQLLPVLIHVASWCKGSANERLATGEDVALHQGHRLRV